MILTMATFTPISAQRKAGMSARELWQAVQEAAGGKSRLGSIVSLRLKGTHRMYNQWFKPDSPGVVKEYQDYGVEIRALLPDHYARLRPTHPLPSNGFRRDVSLDGHRLDHAASPYGIHWEHVHFARLMLALILRTDTLVSLRLNRDVQDAGTLTFTGPNELVTLLDVDLSTTFPVRIRWHQRMLRGGPDQPVEWTLEERRLVDGLNLPHRMVLRQAGKPVEALLLDSVATDVGWTSADFATEDRGRLPR